MSDNVTLPGGAVVATHDISSVHHQRTYASRRPAQYAALGSYAISLVSGTMAAAMAANSEVLQFRWTHASNLALIHDVTIEGVHSLGTGFTAGQFLASLTVARTWSADGTGGTASTLTGNSGKLRASMGTTLAGTIRVATTAALGAGTKTLDAHPQAGIAGGVGTAAFTSIVNWTKLLSCLENDHPIVLVTNEGLTIRMTVPATGTWAFSASVRWSEVGSW